MKEFLKKLWPFKKKPDIKGTIKKRPKLMVVILVSILGLAGAQPQVIAATNTIATAILEAWTNYEKTDAQTPTEKEDDHGA